MRLFVARLIRTPCPAHGVAERADALRTIVGSTVGGVAGQARKKRISCARSSPKA